MNLSLASCCSIVKAWWPRSPCIMFRLASVLLLVLLVPQFIAQAADSTFIHPRDDSCTDGYSKRSLFNIIWGCMLTTIICAWAAIHPNIPPREGPVKGTLRRVELMLWTIVAPEILPAWALNQLLAAMTVRDLYNTEKGYKEESCGIGKTVMGWFSFYERKESSSQAWTVQHGHFLIMGGIHLVESVEGNSISAEATTGATDDVQPMGSSPSVSIADAERAVPHTAEVEEGKVTILTLEMLRELVKDPLFKIRITEDEISDRSKGDALSKLIFMLQTSWFIVQCIARRIQGLGLTHLELTTLALASLNGITFILWWQKPLGAQAIVRVYLNRKLTATERNVEQRHKSFRSRKASYFKKAFERGQAVMIHNRRWTTIVFGGMILIPFVIAALPLRLLFEFISTLLVTGSDVVGGGAAFFPADATHVSTFYVPKHRYYQHWHGLVLGALGSIFGAIHCAGWNFLFPSFAQQLLWHAASLAVTLIPILTLPIAIIILFIVKLLLVITQRIFGTDDLAARFVARIRARSEAAGVIEFSPLGAAIGYVATIFIPMYAAARLVLFVHAITLLRHLPPSALRAVDWTRFYPHIL